MSNINLYKSFTAYLVIIAFLSCDVAQAVMVLGSVAPNISTKVSFNEVIADPSRIQIPHQHATLKEVHQGTNGKFIVHIQDAHANLSGQKSLAETLRHFITQYGIELILVEGSSSDVTLDDVKELASQSDWKSMAGKLLFDGIISGEEYLNLTSDIPMKLLGVEYEALYNKGLNSYARLAEHRKNVTNYLHVIKKALARVKNKLYPKELLAYEILKDNDADAGNSFKTRINELFELSEGFDIDLNKYEQIVSLKLLQDQESQLKFDQANSEQGQLLKELKRRGESALVAEFLSASKRTRGSQISQYTLINNLLASAKDNGIALESFPTLLRYQDYLMKFGLLKLDILLDEIDSFENEVYAHFLISDKLNKIRAIDRFVGLLDKAYRIQMSSNDYQSYLNNRTDFPTSSWLGYLNRQLVDLNYYEDIIPYKPYFEDGQIDIEEFYELVDQRDVAFMENSNYHLEANNQKAAFLIAGGYHTAHLTELMRDEGYSYVVLTPVVKAETDHQRYEQMLLAGHESASHEVSMDNAQFNPDGFRQSGARMGFGERLKSSNGRFSSSLPRRILQKLGGLRVKGKNVVRKRDEGVRITRETNISGDNASPWSVLYQQASTSLDDNNKMERVIDRSQLLTPSQKEYYKQLIIDDMAKMVVRDFLLQARRDRLNSAYEKASQKYATEFETEALGYLTNEGGEFDGRYDMDIVNYTRYLQQRDDRVGVFFHVSTNVGEVIKNGGFNPDQLAKKSEEANGLVATKGEAPGTLFLTLGLRDAIGYLQSYQAMSEKGKDIPDAGILLVHAKLDNNSTIIEGREVRVNLVSDPDSIVKLIPLIQDPEAREEAVSLENSPARSETSDQTTEEAEAPRMSLEDPSKQPGYENVVTDLKELLTDKTGSQTELMMKLVSRSGNSSDFSELLTAVIMEAMTEVQYNPSKFTLLNLLSLITHDENIFNPWLEDKDVSVRASAYRAKNLVIKRKVIEKQLQQDLNTGLSNSEWLRNATGEIERILKSGETSIRSDLRGNQVSVGVVLVKTAEGKRFVEKSYKVIKTVDEDNPSDWVERGFALDYISTQWLRRIGLNVPGVEIVRDKDNKLLLRSEFIDGDTIESLVRDQQNFGLTDEQKLERAALGIGAISVLADDFHQGNALLSSDGHVYGFDWEQTFQFQSDEESTQKLIKDWISQSGDTPPAFAREFWTGVKYSSIDGWKTNFDDVMSDRLRYLAAKIYHYPEDQLAGIVDYAFSFIDSHSYSREFLERWRDVRNSIGFWYGAATINSGFNEDSSTLDSAASDFNAVAGGQTTGEAEESRMSDILTNTDATSRMTVRPVRELLEEAYDEQKDTREHKKTVKALTRVYRLVSSAMGLSDTADEALRRTKVVRTLNGGSSFASAETKDADFFINLSLTDGEETPSINGSIASEVGHTIHHMFGLIYDTQMQRGVMEAYDYLATSIVGDATGQDWRDGLEVRAFVGKALLTYVNEKGKTPNDAFLMFGPEEWKDFMKFVAKKARADLGKTESFFKEVLYATAYDADYGMQHYVGAYILSNLLEQNDGNLQSVAIKMGLALQNQDSIDFTDPQAFIDSLSDPDQWRQIISDQRTEIINKGVYGLLTSMVQKGMKALISNLRIKIHAFIIKHRSLKDLRNGASTGDLAKRGSDQFGKIMENMALAFQVEEEEVRSAVTPSLSSTQQWDTNKFDKMQIEIFNDISAETSKKQGYEMMKQLMARDILRNRFELSYTNFFDSYLTQSMKDLTQKYSVRLLWNRATAVFRRSFAMASSAAVNVAKYATRLWVQLNLVLIQNSLKDVFDAMTNEEIRDRTTEVGIQLPIVGSRNLSPGQTQEFDETANVIHIGLRQTKWGRPTVITAILDGDQFYIVDGNGIKIDSDKNSSYEIKTPWLQKSYILKISRSDGILTVSNDGSSNIVVQQANRSEANEFSKVAAVVVLLTLSNEKQFSFWSGPILDHIQDAKNTAAAGDAKQTNKSLESAAQEIAREINSFNDVDNSSEIAALATIIKDEFTDEFLVLKYLSQFDPQLKSLLDNNGVDDIAPTKVDFPLKIELPNIPITFDRSEPPSLSVPEITYFDKVNDIRIKTLQPDKGGNIVDVSQAQVVVAKALQRDEIVLVGDSHINVGKHELFAQFIDETAKSGIDFSIGLELNNEIEDSLNDPEVPVESVLEDIARLSEGGVNFLIPGLREIIPIARKYDIPMIAIDQRRNQFDEVNGLMANKIDRGIAKFGNKAVLVMVGGFHVQKDAIPKHLEEKGLPHTTLELSGKKWLSQKQFFDYLILDEIEPARMTVELASQKFLDGRFGELLTTADQIATYFKRIGSNVGSGDIFGKVLQTRGYRNESIPITFTEPDITITIIPTREGVYALDDAGGRHLMVSASEATGPIRLATPAETRRFAPNASNLDPRIAKSAAQRLIPSGENLEINVAEELFADAFNREIHKLFANAAKNGGHDVDVDGGFDISHPDYRQMYLVTPEALRSGKYASLIRQGATVIAVNTVGSDDMYTQTFLVDLLGFALSGLDGKTSSAQRFNEITAQIQSALGIKITIKVALALSSFEDSPQTIEVIVEHTIPANASKADIQAQALSLAQVVWAA